MQYVATVLLHNIHPAAEVVFAWNETCATIVEMGCYIERDMRGCVCERSVEVTEKNDTAIEFTMQREELVVSEET